ncbi:ATP-binding protein, partial [Candidatus Gottesmanbacteria bacterium]|nr:ATP-binding protein [Candidatus Gottesmanbacteria bacterium]
MSFINRIKELNWLEEAYQKAFKSGQLLVLYGKRRVGKTELITHFVKSKPHIYYLANRTTKNEQLQSVTAVFMAGFSDTYLASSSFPNWREFFDYLIKKIGERKKMERPLVLIFDEFPYLAEADGGISSFFQYGWDMGLKNKKVLLIIMGSSISMMYKHALVKSAPLYGRRTGQWLLEPFNFRETKKFYPEAPFANSFPLFALSGGIPAYARVFDGKKTLKENIMENILPEGKYLSVEPELLLSEEFDDARVYLTILQAVGLGRTKFSEILQQSHLPATALPIYLQTLTELRLLK